MALSPSIFYFYSFNQQSEYKVLYTLMGWLAVYLADWRDDVPSSEETSFTVSQVNWPPSFQSSYGVFAWEGIE